MVLLLLQAAHALLLSLCVLGCACFLFIRFMLINLSPNLLCFKGKNRKEAADHHNDAEEDEPPLHVLRRVGSYRSSESIHDLTRQIRANQVSCVTTENEMFEWY